MGVQKQRKGRIVRQFRVFGLVRDHDGIQKALQIFDIFVEVADIYHGRVADRTIGQSVASEFEKVDGISFLIKIVENFMVFSEEAAESVEHDDDALCGRVLCTIEMNQVSIPSRELTVFHMILKPWADNGFHVGFEFFCFKRNHGCLLFFVR